jgi:hypothetical protein
MEYWAVPRQEAVSIENSFIYLKVLEQRIVLEE